MLDRGDEKRELALEISESERFLLRTISIDVRCMGGISQREIFACKYRKLNVKSRKIL